LINLRCLIYPLIGNPGSHTELCCS